MRLDWPWVLDKIVTIGVAAYVAHRLTVFRERRKSKDRKKLSLQRLAREVELLRTEICCLGMHMQSLQKVDGMDILEVQQDFPGYADLRDLAEQLDDPGEERLLRDWYAEVSRALAFAYDYFRLPPAFAENWGISFEEWERRGKDTPHYLVNLSKSGETLRDSILKKIGQPPGHSSAMGDLERPAEAASH